MDGLLGSHLSELIVFFFLFVFKGLVNIRLSSLVYDSPLVKYIMRTALMRPMRNSVISLTLGTEPELKFLLRTPGLWREELRKHSNLLQKRCREIQNPWWTDKVAELQQLADLNDTKVFYQSMQDIWGSQANHPDQLLASDNSTLLTEKQDLLDRWTHFRALLNVHTDVSPNLADSMPQSPVDSVQQWMVAIPTLNEVRLVVSLLSSGKVPGADGIHPAIIQHDGQKLLEALH